jgi:16S rRNA (adenine1518-N6/adenine1519-N6)-dimethyltransferase
VTAAGSRLLGAADVRDIAARLDLRPSKRLGQNFVIDQGTVRRVVALAGVQPDEHVLEVGPGLGSLTLALLPAARRVLAVEIDPVLAAALPGTVASFAPGLAGRLEVVTADAARVSGLPGEPVSVLVANLPYSSAVPVLLHLLDTVPSLSRGVFMVQAEVAARMTAPPGNRVYGVPTVKLAWSAQMRRVGPVPRSVFWPVPRVDSGLVAFTRRDPPVPGVRRQDLFAVVDAAFAQRRKMLRSALSPWAGSPAQAERILHEAGVDPAARGESLGVAEFAGIAQARARLG